MRGTLRRLSMADDRRRWITCVGRMPQAHKLALPSQIPDCKTRQLPNGHTNNRKIGCSCKFDAYTIGQRPADAAYAGKPEVRLQGRVSRRAGGIDQMLILHPMLAHTQTKRIAWQLPVGVQSAALCILF